jgi:methionyl-tRNA formyltransferase
VNQIRALVPWPTAFTVDGANPLQILKASPGERSAAPSKPGTILEISGDGFMRIQTGDGSVCVSRVKPAGRKEMSGSEYACGRRIQTGYCLGNG